MQESVDKETEVLNSEGTAQGWKASMRPKRVMHLGILTPSCSFCDTKASFVNKVMDEIRVTHISSCAGQFMVMLIPSVNSQGEVQHMNCDFNINENFQISQDIDRVESGGGVLRPYIQNDY